MTHRDDTRSAWRQPVTAAHRRQLHEIAQLAAEYAELADRTGNADLTALVFQVQLVLGDDRAGASRGRFVDRTGG